MMQTVIRTPLQLGAALRRRRRALVLTQAELGDRLNLRQATVSALESGAADAKLSTVMEILGALELELVVRPRGHAKTAAPEDVT